MPRMRNNDVMLEDAQGGGGRGVRVDLRPYVIWGSIAVALAALTLGGGSSRAVAASLLFVRPVVVLAVTLLLLTMRRGALASHRVPLLLLISFGAVMGLQMVPLPAVVWEALPGRAGLAAAAARGGLPVTYHTMSLTPDLTFNALISLFPALLGLLIWPSVSSGARYVLLFIVLAVATLSAVLGIAQLGVEGLEIYAMSHHQMAAGLFANRNHQAALLAMALPLLRMWSIVSRQPGRGLIATGMGLLFVLVIFATGSRAGVVLALVAGIAMLVVAPPQQAGWRRRKSLLVGAAVVMATVSLVTVAIFTGSATSFDRFKALSASSDLRFVLMPAVWRMAMSYFPFGAGAGSFDPAFRLVEPDWALRQSYFNHAHNDLLELWADGGVPFIIILAGFVGWFLIRFFKAPDRSTIETANGRLAGLAIAVLLSASLVDYPLRTPLLGCLFGLLVAMMVAPLGGANVQSWDKRLYPLNGFS